MHMSFNSEASDSNDMGLHIVAWCWNFMQSKRKYSAVKYQEILENNLWPVLARHFSDGMYRFQDDNAPVHRARIIEE